MRPGINKCFPKHAGEEAQDSEFPLFKKSVVNSAGSERSKLHAFIIMLIRKSARVSACVSLAFMWRSHDSPGTWNKTVVH